jgi:hypothetical protein
MDSCALVKITFYSKPEMSVWFWKVICWYQNGGCIFDRTGCFSDLLQLVLRIYDCRFLERSSISLIVFRCFYQNYAHWNLMVLGDKLFHRKKIMKMLVKYKSIKDGVWPQKERNTLYKLPTPPPFDYCTPSLICSNCLKVTHLLSLTLASGWPLTLWTLKSFDNMH